MIDVCEGVAIIKMFNGGNFDVVNHPIKAYSFKAKMLELYLDDTEFYRKYVNIIPDI